MPGNNDLNQFLNLFENKINASLANQKTQYDSCIHWLILINGGIMAIIIKDYDILNNNGHNFIFLLLQVGILWTILMMFRACRAYLNIQNFDFILKELGSTLLSTSNNNIKDKINELLKYDYGEEHRKYIGSRFWIFVEHLFGREFGMSLFLFLLVMSYSGCFNFCFNLQKCGDPFLIISIGLISWSAFKYVIK